MTLDILFLSWNRWEFTECALRHLFRNTEWTHVRKLVVYDDESAEPAAQRLRQLLDDSPVEVALRVRRLRSPVAVMLDYLGSAPADVFCKLDNDIVVPPGWLPEMLAVWTDHMDLLGMEIGHPMGLGYPEITGERVFVPCSHIGGVGLMRSGAFLEARHAMRPNGRFGFTEWQHTERPVRGWIFPEILAVCLDRVPVEPWAGLSAAYRQAGWQRDGYLYPLDATRYWDWIT